MAIALRAGAGILPSGGLGIITLVVKLEVVAGAVFALHDLFLLSS